MWDSFQHWWSYAQWIEIHQIEPAAKRRFVEMLPKQRLNSIAKIMHYVTKTHGGGGYIIKLIGLPRLVLSKERIEISDNPRDTYVSPFTGELK